MLKSTLYFITYRIEEQNEHHSPYYNPLPVYPVTSKTAYTKGFGYRIFRDRFNSSNPRILMQEVVEQVKEPQSNKSNISTKLYYINHPPKMVSGTTSTYNYFWLYKFHKHWLVIHTGRDLPELQRKILSIHHQYNKLGKPQKPSFEYFPQMQKEEEEYKEITRLERELSLHLLPRLSQYKLL